MEHSLTPKALALACALAMSAIASAQTADVQKDETKAKENVHALAPVTVDEEMDKNGVTTIRAVELDMLPSATGTINDAFRGNSFVQFDTTSRSGGQGAEILPPRISIRGGRNYENAYLINGLSNNNLLNPSGFDADMNANTWQMTSHMPQGDAQTIMLDTDMLESLTVMSENVSAEYGNFTGGVVNAKIRDAKTDRWHAKLWTTHTRDSWAKMHETERQEGIDRPVDGQKLQKEFKKSTVGVVLEGPLADGKLGAMISYQKTHATAPVYRQMKANGKPARPYAGEEMVKSKRDKENFMVRLNTDKNEDFYINSTLIYSPYTSNYLVTNTRLTEREVNGTGFNWTVNTVSKLGLGEWKNDFSISKNEIDRLAETNISYQRHFKDPGSWGSTFEGDRGDQETEQLNVNMKSVLDLKPIEMGFMSHSVKVGLEGMYTRVKNIREGYTHYMSTKQNATTTLPNDTEGHWDGRWYDTQVVNDAFDQSEKYFTLSAFAEDAIQIERFTFRPGVRIDHDDITSNVNVAPRISFDIDVLNDTRFNINGGYNRYFGNQVLSQAVAANQSYVKRMRANENVDWKDANVIQKFKGQTGSLGDLDTPYSDEFVLGASAKVWNNTIFRIQGVVREHKDLLTCKSVLSEVRGEPNGYQMENGGKSSYKGVTFSVEKGFDFGKWGRHYSEFGITWSDLEGNTDNWSDSFLRNGADDGRDKVWLDGKLINAEDFNASNFNAEVVATYTQRSYFFDDKLRTTILARYESACDGLNRLEEKEDPLTHIEYLNYETIENGKLFNVDLNVEYDLIKTVDSTLTLNMEVLNLFDRKSRFNIGNTMQFGSGEGMMMGRQFWLGMSYTY